MSEYEFYYKGRKGEYSKRYASGQELENDRKRFKEAGGIAAERIFCSCIKYSNKALRERHFAGIATNAGLE